ncbi:MAG TPA: hypothetical protein VIH90_03400, partial [Candidatus Saccharimonadales bacterium]
MAELGPATVPKLLVSTHQLELAVQLQVDFSLIDDWTESISGERNVVIQHRVNATSPSDEQAETTFDVTIDQSFAIEGEADKISDAVEQLEAEDPLNIADGVIE